MESELNRVQWFEAWHGLKSELLQFKNQARDLGALASAVAKLLPWLAIARRILRKSTATDGSGEPEANSWPVRICQWARTGAQVWSALRKSRS